LYITPFSFKASLKHKTLKLNQKVLVEYYEYLGC
jgi:hypothetical protein